MPASGIAAPVEQATGPAASGGASELRVQRILKILVVALALLLFAGLAAAIGRVVYLASAPATQPAAPTPAIRPEQSLELPAGAQVRSVSISGSRVAVHYDLGGTAGIAVLDLETGRMITNIGIATKPAGR